MSGSTIGAAVRACLHLRTTLLQQLAVTPPTHWNPFVSMYCDGILASGLDVPPIVYTMLAQVSNDVRSLPQVLAFDQTDPFATLMNEHPSDIPVSRLVEQFVTEFTAWLNRQVAAEAAHPAVRAALRHINAHYHKPLTLASIAGAVGRDKAYLATLFRQYTGITIHTYVVRTRLRVAQDLILRGEKIEAIALSVGYRSKKNFYRQFQDLVGCPPGAYRRLALHEANQLTRHAPAAADTPAGEAAGPTALPAGKTA